MPGVNAGKDLGRGTAGLLLAALLLSLAVTHGWWTAKDTDALPSTDAYNYLSGALRAYQAIRDTGAWWPDMADLSLDGRPPLYQLATLPILATLGPSVDRALWVNLPFLVLLGWATYALGALVGRRRTGLVAAFLVLTAPPVLHLSRTYRPKFAQVAWAALCLWLIAMLIEKRRPRDGVALGVALGIGLLLHPTFVWSVLGAVGVFGIVALFAPERRGTGPWLDRRLLLRGLLPGAVLALGIAALWYAGPGWAIVDLYRQMSSGDLLAFRGYEAHTQEFGHVPGTFWWYARTAPAALGWIFCIAILLGALRLTRARRPVVWIAPVATASSFLLFSAQWTKAWMLMAAALPAAAVWAAWAVDGIGPPRLRRVAITAVLVAGAASFTLVTWGTPAWRSPAWQAYGARFPNVQVCRSSRGLCPAAPQQDPRPTAQIVDQAFEAGGCIDRRARPCLLMVINGPHLNAAKFRFDLLADGRSRSMQVGAQGNAAWLKRRYPLNRLLHADFIVYEPIRAKSQAPLSDYHTASVQLLEEPPRAFADAHRILDRIPIQVANGPPRQAILLQRIRPPTAAEARDVHGALALHDRHKPNWRRALEKLPREGRPKDAETKAADPTEEPS